MHATTHFHMSMAYQTILPIQTAGAVLAQGRAWHTVGWGIKERSPSCQSSQSHRKAKQYCDEA